MLTHKFGPRSLSNQTLVREDLSTCAYTCVQIFTVYGSDLRTRAEQNSRLWSVLSGQVIQVRPARTHSFVTSRNVLNFVHNQISFFVLAFGDCCFCRFIFYVQALSLCSHYCNSLVCCFVHYLTLNRQHF